MYLYFTFDRLEFFPGYELFHYTESTKTDTACCDVRMRWHHRVCYYTHFFYHYYLPRSYTHVATSPFGSTPLSSPLIGSDSEKLQIMTSTRVYALHTTQFDFTSFYELEAIGIGIEPTLLPIDCVVHSVSLVSVVERTPLTRNCAALSLSGLHFSPSPRSVPLGLESDSQFYKLTALNIRSHSLS